MRPPKERFEKLYREMSDKDLFDVFSEKLSDLEPYVLAIVNMEVSRRGGSNVLRNVIAEAGATGQEQTKLENEPEIQKAEDKTHQVQARQERTHVILTDVDLPFRTLVFFMVKWAIASIPAFIILLLLGILFVFIFGGILAGMVGGL